MSKAKGFNLLLKLPGYSLLAVEEEGFDSYDGSRPPIPKITGPESMSASPSLPLGNSLIPAKPNKVSRK